MLTDKNTKALKRRNEANRKISGRDNGRSNRPGWPGNGKGRKEGNIGLSEINIVSRPFAERGGKKWSPFLCQGSKAFRCRIKTTAGSQAISTYGLSFSTFLSGRDCLAFFLLKLSLVDRKGEAKEGDGTSLIRMKVSYVVSPGDVVSRWVGPHVTFEVHVIALFDVLWVEAGAERQRGRRHI